MIINTNALRDPNRRPPRLPLVNFSFFFQSPLFGFLKPLLHNLLECERRWDSSEEKIIALVCYVFLAIPEQNSRKSSL